jgi:hypothetical protein
MARSHAKLFCSIWEDEDFIALPGSAQRLYMLLISQRKTTMVGCLDLKPARWARLAPDTTIDDIRHAARQLAAARFIVLDEETDELVVRTLVRHDGIRAVANSKLLMGFWGQWEAIESPALRRVVIDNVPDDVWEAKRFTPPAAALEMRRSDPPEPPVPTDGSNRERELVPSNGSDHRTDPARAHVPPSAFRLPPSALSSSVVTETGDEPMPVDDDDRDPLLGLVTATAVVLGDRDHRQALDDGVEVRNRRAHRDACIERWCADQRLADAAVANPDLRPDQLADVVDPPPKPVLSVVPERAPPLVPYEPEPPGEVASPEVVRAALAAIRRPRSAS